LQLLTISVANSAKKVVLSALPLSAWRAALTNTLESIVSNRTLPPHLLKLSNGRSCFLARFFAQLIDQNLPSTPGMINVRLVQQPFAGVDRNNQSLHASAFGHGVGNAPTFHFVDNR
jgi:hypothetical protein